MRNERFVIEKYSDGTVTLDWSHFDENGHKFSAGPHPVNEAEAAEKLRLLFNPPEDTGNE